MVEQPVQIAAHDLPVGADGTIGAAVVEHEYRPFAVRATADTHVDFVAADGRVGVDEAAFAAGEGLGGGKQGIESSLLVGQWRAQRPDLVHVVTEGPLGASAITAARALGIPVTNCPDTFIEEVADHAMTLILASWRRLVVQDQMVRKGDWGKARPMLYQFPRLMGMTLGFISFGHVARAVAKRAAPFGFQMLAYDPYIEELVMSDYGVQPVGYDELMGITEVWVDTALTLGDKSLKMMERIVRAQEKRSIRAAW